MIPKVIHYIWLGGNPLPKIAEKCMESWKKYCPDFEIKRWDETNLNLDINTYCRQAYDSKKWAFASDVLRYYILAEEGGIYLDIDVELLKPIDEFLYHQCFTACETDKSIAPGLIFGCEKGNVDALALFNMYNGELFINHDGSYNMKTICQRANEYYIDNGYVFNGEKQMSSTTAIYPKDYFNPIELNTQKLRLTNNTYSIHHYNASWYTKGMKFKRGVKTFLNKISFGLFGKLFLRK